MKIPVVQQILNANDQVAVENRAAFDGAGVFVLNLMASPGAGKTSMILATVARLPSAPLRQPFGFAQDAAQGRLCQGHSAKCASPIRPGVIEGDLASTIDAEAIAAHGIPVVQINTGGNCHLDAPMIRSALPHLPLADIDLLFIENVGNLICPAEFDLGADLAVVVASTPEGHDKPYKYPGMFAAADVVLLNKADLLEVFDFDLAYFRRGIEMVNPRAPLFVVSCRTGKGIDEWVAWLMELYLQDTASASKSAAWYRGSASGRSSTGWRRS